MLSITGKLRKALAAAAALVLLAAPVGATAQESIDLNALSKKFDTKQEFALPDGPISPSVHVDADSIAAARDAIKAENAAALPEATSLLSAESRGGSTPVVPGEAYALRINSSTLMHTFTFNVPFNNEGAFLVRTTAYRSSVLLMLEDANGRTQVLKTAKYGEDSEVPCVVLPAGSYKVSALINTDYSGTLFFGYVLMDDAPQGEGFVYEFDDNNETAKAIELGADHIGYGTIHNALMAGTTAALADMDYYSVTLAAPSYLSINIATRYGVFFALEDADGNILNYALDPTANSLAGMSTGNGLTGFDTGLLPAGKYYILVMGNPDVPSTAGAPYYVRCDTRASGFKDVDYGTPHLEHINWLANAGISKGWREPNGYTFRPFANVARADMAAFLYRLVGSPEYTPSAAECAKFRDVDSNTPHAKEIWWLASTGISAGWNMGSGVYEFRPYAEVTRCDMAAFLYRLAGSPAFEPNASERAAFRDVNASTPHANEIFWLASSGISTGWNESDGSKTFRPYNIVVRCDMSAFLHRMSDYGLLPAE
ncbi:S-layer homology domain-containing protein [Collinsella sp. D33t1_170424_A12]|uniref:S-layer homology domain-containing protein n=1 Tax=Collinsella sp. D33t1_170424_A12 TaxID=2787135 RepID=UPI00189A9A3F|nr:S-layer homology domain-containing protein [Collinsella sp. D33t1_170424_A12]